MLVKRMGIAVDEEDAVEAVEPELAVSIKIWVGHRLSLRKSWRSLRNGGKRW